MGAFTIIFLTLFGLGVGTVGTMIGAGSGWLHVPFLMLVFGFSPQDAVGTSIAIIFLNTLAGSFIYTTQKRVDYKFSWRLAAATAPGAIIGPFIVQSYTHHAFSFIFGFVLLAIAYHLVYLHKKIYNIGEKMMQRDKMTVTTAAGKTYTYSTNMEIGIIGSFLIGFLSNLLGIGGGILHVPFMILTLRVPTHIAVATSHFVLFVSSALGTLMFTILGNVRIDYMMSIGIGTIFGAMLGAELSSKSSDASIRRTLAVVVAVVSVYMIISAISGF